MFYEVFIMLPYLYEAIYKRAQDFNETKWYLSIQQPTATIYHFHIKQNHFHNKQQQFLAMINLNFIKNIEGATFIYKSNPYKNINMILIIQTPSLSNKLSFLSNKLLSVHPYSLSVLMIGKKKERIKTICIGLNTTR